MAEEKTQPTQPTTVNNNMVKAIITTLCCCLPLGIVSIIKAAEVNKKVATGDMKGAQISADEANKWANIGLITALVGWLIYLFVVVVFGVGTFMSF